MTTRPTSDYASGSWAHVFGPRKDGERRYWLVKSEPDVFSFVDLMVRPERTAHWDGVRNYSARNFMLDGMQLGDLVFFYHSSTDPQAIVGIAEVVKLAYPDHTQFEEGHHGYDADAKADAPTWWMVDLRAVEALPRGVTLAEIKTTPALAEMSLLRVGRLSVVPVTPREWATVLAMAAKPAAAVAAKTPTKTPTKTPAKTPAKTSPGKSPVKQAAPKKTSVKKVVKKKAPSRKK